MLERTTKQQFSKAGRGAGLLFCTPGMFDSLDGSTAQPFDSTFSADHKVERLSQDRETERTRTTVAASY
jgi:hypothetical protein